MRYCRNANKERKSKIKYFVRNVSTAHWLCDVHTLHKKCFTMKHCSIGVGITFFKRNYMHVCRVHSLDFLRDTSDEVILYIHELRCETWLQKRSILCVCSILRKCRVIGVSQFTMNVYIFTVAYIVSHCYRK